MREYIASAGMKVFQAELYNFYLRTYPSLVEDGELEKVDNYADNVLRFSSQFNMANPFSEDTPQVVFALYGTNVGSYVELPSVKERKTPLALYEGFTAKHEITINLPYSIGWELDDKEFQIEDEGVIYSRTINTSEKQINILHHYKTKSDHVSVVGTKQHIANIRAIRDAVYYQVTVPNDQSSIKMDLQERLRRALGKG